MMTRFLWFGFVPATLLTATVGATPLLAATPPAPVVIDGRVNDLSPAVFAELKLVRQRNPNSLNQVDAQQIATAIRKDGKIDAAEADLLTEMTQSQIRIIRIYAAGMAPTSDQFVQTLPAAGNAKRVLLNVLNPVPDLAAEWAKPNHGWDVVVTDYKSSPEREAKVLAFVTEELAKKWEVSNAGNSYKLLRDEIARLYGLGNSPMVDSAASRNLLYRAMSTLDSNATGVVPDLWYNWIRPGGAL